MRPLALHGHTRAVTMVKYNREGDLLFSTAKDTFPTVWDSITGERLGTYDGHSGAVWGLDVNASSTLLATAGADQTVKIWNVETGKEYASINLPTAVRGVAWSHGDRLLACLTDKSMNKIPAINFFNIPDRDQLESNQCAYNPTRVLAFPEKVNCAVWGPDNSTIYFCSEDGSVAILDVETGKEKCFSLPHDGCEARRLSWDSEHCCLITAGWDKTSKLLDGRDVKVVKTYKNDFNVNDAVIVPNNCMNQVIIAGGIDAQSVTNVGGNQNKFDIRFVHKIFEETLGTIAGHFGPVNALAVEPNGHGFCSGGEDGFVRLHHFDPDYYDAPGKLSEFDYGV